MKLLYDSIKKNWTIWLLILATPYMAYKQGVLDTRHEKANIQQQYMNQEILNQITEIKLRMQKNGLMIKGVQRIIDSIPDIYISSEESFRYAEEIISVADRYGIEPSKLTSVIFKESKFNPKAVSRVGAKGMGQIMPETMAWICREWNMTCGKNTLFDPIINIRMTGWYLDWLYKMIGDWGKTFAYYNGGGKQAYRWALHWKREQGVSLDSLENIHADRLASETKDYVYTILKNDSLFRKKIHGILPSETMENHSERRKNL